MFGLPLIFAAPAVLVTLVGLGALYFLLRVTPPAPRRTVFPPLRLLIGLASNETEPARTPWPILALRMAVAALIILAMAQPLWTSLAGLAGAGPLLVLIDDGWAAAPTFDKRVAFARQRMDAAARSGRIVAVKPLSAGAREVAPLDAAEIEGRLRSLAPVPYEPPRANSMPAIERFLSREPKTEVLWIADGVELGGAGGFAARLASLSRSVEVATDGIGARAIAGVENESGALTVRVVRSDERALARGSVRALDPRGREIARAPFEFNSSLVTTGRFELPVELRNEVAEVVIEGERSAGAAWLMDDRSRRRRVAIASGASADIAQPLLAPSYYLKRALEPFADVSESHDSSSDPVVSLLAEGPSVLALADMSVAPGAEHDAIVSFLDKGGVLLRFAGSRLAAGDDDLTPSDLRRGGRRLGGALSWETPKHIAPFSPGSPFFGLSAPDEVTVTRQVLAEPTAGLDDKIWARLADGTPLVTAARHGNGLIVLFHVTADTTWSNLPLSGLFVDMLRRVVAEAGPSVQATAKAGAIDRSATFPPWRTLTGFGALGPPPAQAEPIGADFAGLGDAIHPPGFYGSPESPRAVNALAAAQSLPGADYGALKVRRGLDITPPIDLRQWLLPVALIGLTIDAFISIWAAGGAGLRRRGAIVAVALAAHVRRPPRSESGPCRGDFGSCHGLGAVGSARLCGDGRRHGGPDVQAGIDLTDACAVLPDVRRSRRADRARSGAR